MSPRSEASRDLVLTRHLFYRLNYMGKLDLSDLYSNASQRVKHCLHICWIVELVNLQSLSYVKAGEWLLLTLRSTLILVDEVLCQFINCVLEVARFNLLCSVVLFS